MTILNCGLIRMTGGVKRMVGESMEDDWCIGTVIKEIVEDNESEGVGEGEERPGREEGK